MAAFSYQNPLPNFLNLESSVNLFPNPLLIPTTNSIFADHHHLHPNISHLTTNFFTTLHDEDHHHQQQQLLDNNNNNIIINLDDHQANSNYSSSSPADPNYNNINNNNNIHHKQSPDSSSVVLDHKLESGDDIEQYTDDDQKVLAAAATATATAAVPPVLFDKKRKPKNGSSLNSSAQSKDTREMNKWKRQKKSINCQEAKKEKKEEKKKASEEAPPVGYIHVRARRGQATDSHSLAERVRREKISERMKLLQALVPGCDKVTGKALMLDEIINYVQSLQNQVEFLSMKLASVNPLFYDFGVDIDSFMVKPAEQNLSSLGGVLPAMENVQQCNASNTFSIPNNYPLIIDSSSTTILFQQQQEAQIPNILSQNNGQLLWDVDDQRQKLINHSSLSNNLSSFH